MERRGNRQRHAALDLELLDHGNRPLDRAEMARKHDLGRIVVVGDGANFTCRCRIRQLLRLVDIRAEQRTHRAHADRHRRLHRLASQFKQPGRVCERERPGGTKRRIFAQAVPGDEIALVGQLDPAFTFQHPQRGDGIGHDCSLRIFGQHQLIVGAIAHDREQLLAQRIVHFLENFARGNAGQRQLDPHPNLLATLTRKHECTHETLLSAGGY